MDGMKLWVLGAIIFVALGGLFIRQYVPPTLRSSDSGIPLPQWQDRVTKKTFGLYVDPAHSPVQPERFTGYHTGTDFEVLPGEDETKLVARAVCDGKVLLARRASGYGGVVVQSCTINGRPVTVIYGHLNPTGFLVTVGAQLHRGDAIGSLGKGYSTQTDGERPHLHLGIHRGTTVNITGYVKTKADLAGWLDPLAVLQ